MATIGNVTNEYRLANQKLTINQLFKTNLSSAFDDFLFIHIQKIQINGFLFTHAHLFNFERDNTSLVLIPSNHANSIVYCQI